MTIMVSENCFHTVMLLSREKSSTDVMQMMCCAAELSMTVSGHYKSVNG